MKIIVVAGARPNFMKIAPLMEAFAALSKSSPDLSVQLVHTGQHYDESMSGNFFEELGIRPPDFNLRVGSGSHAEQTARVEFFAEPTRSALGPGIPEPPQARVPASVHRHRLPAGYC